MKRFIFTIGFIATALVIAGSTMKIMHWPGAGISITLGSVLLTFIFLPLFAFWRVKNPVESFNTGMTVMLAIAMFVDFWGHVFAVMHWPGAGALLFLGTFLVVFGFLPLLFINIYKRSFVKADLLLPIILMLSWGSLIFARNVSAEIVKSFYLVNESVEQTSAIVSISNDQKYKLIKIQAEINTTNQNLLDKAEKSRNLINNLISFIEEIKERIITLSGGYTENGYAGAKDLNIPSQVMIFEKKGNMLQQKINSTRQALLELANNDISLSTNFPLKAEDPERTITGIKETWVEHNFQNIPVIAAITLLNKIQADARNAEAEILNYLFSQIAVEDLNKN